MAGAGSAIENALFFKDIKATGADDRASRSQVADSWKLLFYDYEYAAAEERLNLARRYRQRLEQLDKRFENLRRSQSWLARQNSTEAAHLLLAYVEELTPYLRQRELHVELLRWCEYGLRACEKLQRPSGALLLLCGQAHYALGHWDEAITSVQKAIERSQQEDPDLYARATMTLGLYQFNQGNYLTGLETMERAARLPSQQAEYERLAVVRGERAAYALNRGDFDTALALYLQADQLQREAGAHESSDQTLLMLGVVYRRKKRYKLAETYLQQLLDRAEARQHQETIATASHHLAWVWLNEGDTGRAHQMCGKVIVLYETIGNTRGLADAYEQLGAIALAERRKKEAISCLERSLLLRRQLGNRQGEASSLYRLALAHAALWRLGVASALLWQSLNTYQRLGMLSRQRITRMSWQMFSCFLGKRRWSG